MEAEILMHALGLLVDPWVGTRSAVAASLRLYDETVIHYEDRSFRVCDVVADRFRSFYGLSLDTSDLERQEALEASLDHCRTSLPERTRRFTPITDAEQGPSVEPCPETASLILDHLLGGDPVEVSRMVREMMARTDSGFVVAWLCLFLHDGRVVDETGDRVCDRTLEALNRRMCEPGDAGAAPDLGQRQAWFAAECRRAFMLERWEPDHNQRWLSAAAPDFPQPRAYGVRQAFILSSGDLQVLDLSQAGLAWVPQEIDALPHLLILNLADNRLQELPHFLEAARHLTCLDASRNRLTAFPPCVLTLAHLQELRLAGNRVSTVPSRISNLTELRVLDLSDNPISQIPKSLEPLPLLCHLDLRGTAITPEDGAVLRELLPRTRVLLGELPPREHEPVPETAVTGQE
jgi:hypothetical protein